MDLQLKDKVIIVTGGAKGIGAAIATTLANEEAVPVIIGRNESDNKRMIQAIRKNGGQAGYVTAELSDPAQCETAVKKVMEDYKRIDGVVNNAGVNDGVGLESGNYKRFLNSLHNNLVHYYLIAHFTLPVLNQSKVAIMYFGSKTAEDGQGGIYRILSLK